MVHPPPGVNRKGLLALATHSRSPLQPSASPPSACLERPSPLPGLPISPNPAPAAIDGGFVMVDQLNEQGPKDSLRWKRNRENKEELGEAFGSSCARFAGGREHELKNGKETLGTYPKPTSHSSPHRQHIVANASTSFHVNLTTQIPTAVTTSWSACASNGQTGVPDSPQQPNA